ncbi:hypothetical protein NCC78_29755 [Micromonospora phytophila]|uniref:hypothetical protein n=1 Tax=Micromonospora phytophila TaxID=709888 RepID=UPI002030328D|nr:hypothetical protein [Micromonospora phytophila]MCM0678825.1 hypothetical protein [Micromonospora phytophila]
MPTTTWRLARQTARWCRFATVTVHVAAAAGPEVEVLRTLAVTPDQRREAELGAHAALGAGGRHRATVTEIRATEVDTGVGDVHEATARAVGQAVDDPRAPAYVGFGEPDLVAGWLRDRIGLRLDRVTEARHWYGGRRDGDAQSLLHAWLHFRHRPPMRLHGRGEELLLSMEEPYGTYDMAECGETRVGPARPPDVLAGPVGERLTGGAVLVEAATGYCSGLLLRFGPAELLVATLGDEWVLEREPPRRTVEASWSVRSVC